MHDNGENENIELTSTEKSKPENDGLALAAHAIELLCLVHTGNGDNNWRHTCGRGCLVQTGVDCRRSRQQRQIVAVSCNKLSPFPAPV